MFFNLLRLIVVLVCSVQAHNVGGGGLEFKTHPTVLVVPYLQNCYYSIAPRTESSHSSGTYVGDGAERGICP